MEALINKNIPKSVVDGPSNRMSIFLQACNITCAYCHNPETQQMCRNCGQCVDGCPVRALSVASDETVCWDTQACVQYDRCISVCAYDVSPKICWMDGSEVAEKVKENMPFIRGVTVSGGECMLSPEFLTELFSQMRKLGLACLIDSNGTVDFLQYPDLIKVCNGVILDIKSWQLQVFRKLTGGDNWAVKKNLRFLVEHYYFAIIIVFVKKRCIMANIEVFHKKIILFNKNYDKDLLGNNCTSTNSMLIIDGHAYILKSSTVSNSQGNHSAILYYIKNIATDPVPQEPIYITYNNVSYLFQHPNSLAHYNATFYMGNYGKLSSQSDILAFKRNGVIENKYNLSDNLPASSFSGNSISSITYYKNGRFIIGTKKISNGRKYWVIELNNGKIYPILCFTASESNISGWVGNDIHYDSSTNLFYITLSNKGTSNKFQNKILTYDLSNLTDGLILNPCRILLDNLDKEQAESRYEIEALGIYNGKKYVAVERLSTDTPAGYESDGIFKLVAK